MRTIKAIRRILFRSVLAGVLFLCPSIKTTAQWIVKDPFSLTGILDMGITAADQLTTLSETYNTLKTAYSTIESATNFFDGAKEVKELFALIDGARQDYADVVYMIDRVKNTYGASTVMPSSVYITTVSAAAMGIDLADKLIDVVGYAKYILLQPGLDIGDKLRGLQELNRNLRQSREKMQELKNKLTGAIMFHATGSREKGRPAVIVATAFGDFNEKEDFLNEEITPLSDKGAPRKSDKGVLPTIDWGKRLSSGNDGQTLKELEDKAKNSVLTENVFEITQYVIVGIGLLFTGVAYARRNKGDRASTDAIYKVILWFFLIMMIMSAVRAMFF